MDGMDVLDRARTAGCPDGTPQGCETTGPGAAGVSGTAELRGGAGPIVFWARIAGLAALIPTGYLLLLLTLIPLVPFRAARAHWRSAYFRRWTRIALRLINLRIRVAGEPPRPPFLLVSNHLTYLDVLVLAAHLPCVFVSKADVKSWPLMGWICRTLGTIFIDRSSRRDVTRVLAEMEAALELGMGVVLFPEGTSSRGATVEPFKPPLLALAVRLNRPVHCAALGYRTLPGDPPAHLAVCWWNESPFLPHALGVLGLKGIEASIDFLPEPIAEPDRKRLAERLRQAVLERFVPVE